HDGRGHRIEGEAAIDVVLHHHDGDQHDGGGHATEHKSKNAKAATIGHCPLPRGTPRLFCRGGVNLRSRIRVNFCLIVDKANAAPSGRVEAGTGVGRLLVQTGDRKMSVKFVAFALLAATGTVLVPSESAISAGGARFAPAPRIVLPPMARHPRPFFRPSLRS